MNKLPEPLARRILVKIPKVVEEEADGIILAETRREVPQRGEVVKLGQPGDIPFDVEVGDTVIFPSTGHDRVTVNDEQYVLMDESLILAVEEEI